MSRQFAALRGIAMLLVVFHHAVDLTKMAAARQGIAPPSGLGNDLLIVPLYELGIYAVPLFLFVSGAFMAYAAKGTPPTISWAVVQNALKRLLLPYFIWSVILYVEVFFHYGEAHGLMEYIKKLIIGSPFDFVPLLFFFYLVSPFMTRAAVGRRGLLLVLVIGVGQLVIMNIEAPGILGFRFPGWVPNNVPVLGRTLAQFAVYFPLGLVYGLNMKRVNAHLERWKRPLLILTLSLFALHMVHAYGFVRLPLAQYVAALVALFYTPFIERQRIPQVRRIETVSKHSYGLYLTHFVLIDFLLFAVARFAPMLLGWQLPLMWALFALGLLLPTWVMEKLAKVKQIQGVYRAVFG